MRVIPFLARPLYLDTAESKGESERNTPLKELLDRLRAEEVGKDHFTYIVLTLRDQHVEVGHSDVHFLVVVGACKPFRATYLYTGLRFGKVCTATQG